MTFKEVMDQVITWLQQDQRISYRAVKRQFALEDDYLEGLKVELIEVKQVAVDQDGKMLVWRGDTASTPASAPTGPPQQAPLAYTPPYLAEKILTSRSVLEGERKQVTVLFADLKDSTELIRGLDPEAAQQLLDPALHHMMDAVHRFEGTVNQVLGDGIMALFGAPIAHEDHALRACYAALAMQAAMQPPRRRCAAPAVWSCVCVWVSTPAQWWCGPLATTSTWTTPRSARPPISPHAWNSWPPPAAAA